MVGSLRLHSVHRAVVAYRLQMERLVRFAGAAAQRVEHQLLRLL